MPLFHPTDVIGTNFLICSSIGHLYRLVDPRNNRDTYPVFDVKWALIARKQGRLSTKKETASNMIIRNIDLSMLAIMTKRVKLSATTSFNMRAETDKKNL